MKTILIVDDHPIISAGLLFLLKKNFTIADVAFATTGDEANRVIKKKKFDLIVMDVLLPKTDTQALVKRIVTAHPKTVVIMYSSCNEEVYAMPYMQIGAKGYLHKSATDEEVVLAFNTVLSGNLFISKKSATSYNLFHNSDNNNPFGELSKRELEVLSHLLRGRSVKEIAETMNLAQSTIATQKSRIFQKIGVTNIVDLVKLSEQYWLTNLQYV
jgi:two-component system invasion response regulator UvrY